MDNKKLKVYTASSVGIDYFFFLNKTIGQAGYVVEPLFFISEVKYRKFAKAVGIKKIWLRLQMYFCYPLYLLYKGLTSQRGSIFVITSNTFYAPYLMKLVVQFKNGKVIHLLYDLFPDAIEIAGSIGIDSFKSKIIGSITKLNQRKCDATVYLGEFLKVHAENRWGEAVKSSIIDISTDLSLYPENYNSTQSYPKKLIIHYGGQLGNLHDVTSIIKSITYIYDSDISDKVEFNFYVSGAQAKFLERSLKDYPVKIISAIPSSQWREDIRNFHIGLVSLSPGGASVCLPSKTYAMMAAGMAIIAICPEWSDLASLIKKLDSGWIINNSLYRNRREINRGAYLSNLKEKRVTIEIAIDFYDQIKFILNNMDILSDKRNNAFYGVRNNYNINALSEKWKDLIQNV